MNPHPGRRLRARCVRLLVVVAALLFAAPPAAGAHAWLIRAHPQTGAPLRAAPRSVELRFSEAVDARLSELHVTDAGGHAVPLAPLVHPHAQAQVLGAALRSRLPRGGYVIAFRAVASDDGHVTYGQSGFALGAGPRAIAAAPTYKRPVSAAAFTAVRTSEYSAIAVGLGGALFLLFAWAPALVASGSRQHALFTANALKLLNAIACVGLCSSLAGLAMQTASASGSWDAHALPTVLATRAGAVWALSAGAWLLALAALRFAGLRALALCLAPLAVVPPLIGHGASHGPHAVLLPALIIHVGVASVWLGGVVLSAMLLASSGDGARELLFGTLSRFSAMALAAVCTLVATGAAQALLLTRGLESLGSTAYGREVLAKILLVAAIVAMGARNRRRLRAGSAFAVAALRRTLAAEVIVGAAALLLSALLGASAPAVS